MIEIKINFDNIRINLRWGKNIIREGKYVVDNRIFFNIYFLIKS